MDTPATTFDVSACTFETIASDQSPQTSLQQHSAVRRRGRVLVLEDDPLQLKLVQQHLHSVGFEVVTATSIEEARQRLCESGLQLAILDVQLPDGCGFELCEEIDSNAAYAGMPVVVLSSLTEAGAVRRTRASGGRYFLCKPYDPNVLLAIIERALEDPID